MVDEFIVIEAHQTHAGMPKPLHLSESGPPDLLAHPKLSVRAVDLPVGFSDWERDQFQRDAIGDVLRERGAAADDLVLVSDVDEIPAVAAVRRARDALRAATDRTILIFEQRLFYFRLNYELVWSRKLPWPGTAAARFEHARTINGLRTTGRNTRGRHARDFDKGARVFRVPDGGWHFSYFGGDDFLRQKLAAHEEHGAKKRQYGSVQALIEARASLFPRKGRQEIWAVVARASVGLPDPAIERAGVGHLFESPHDADTEILRRVRDASVPRRWRLGRFDLGYARRGPWPRLGER